MLSVARAMPPGACQQRQLYQLELSLGITGLQRPLWNNFVEALEALYDELTEIDVTTSENGKVRAPSLPDLVRAQQSRMVVARRGTRNLLESLDLLYRSLAPRQRGRADRLLLPLCKRIGLSDKVGAPVLPMSLLPTGTPLPPKPVGARPAPPLRSGALSRPNASSNSMAKAQIAAQAESTRTVEPETPLGRGGTPQAVSTRAVPGNGLAMLNAGPAVAAFWGRFVQAWMQDSADFAARLAHCTSPLETPAVYSEWISTRAKRILADGQEVTGFWQAMVAGTMSSETYEPEASGEHKAPRYPDSGQIKKGDDHES